MWPIIYQYAMLMILFLSSPNKLNFIWNTISSLTYFPSILRYLWSFQIAHIILFRSEYMISIKSTLLRKTTISFLSSWSKVSYINDFAAHLIRILKKHKKLKIVCHFIVHIVEDFIETIVAVIICPRLFFFYNNQIACASCHSGIWAVQNSF
jgi:hypothetical protein